MTSLLAVGVSRTTMFGWPRALPLPEPGTITVVGVDDSAFRKGNTNGTIIVDMAIGPAHYGVVLSVRGCVLNPTLGARYRAGSADQNQGDSLQAQLVNEQRKG